MWSRAAHSLRESFVSARRKEKGGEDFFWGKSQTSNTGSEHVDDASSNDSRKSLLGRKNEEPIHVLKGFVFPSSSMALTTDGITGVKC